MEENGPRIYERRAPSLSGEKLANLSHVLFRNTLFTSKLENEIGTMLLCDTIKYTSHGGPGWR